MTGKDITKQAGSGNTATPNRALQTAKIERPERAGRAPYNFVPLAQGGWKEAPEPPSQASYSGNSGEIHIRLRAETDFFLRGMQPLERYDPKKPTADTFQVDGLMRLPGTSLRGMIRSLVEMLARAPLDPVNDDQLFFRAVASVPDPSNRTSFEPQARAYKERIGGGASPLRVKPGYLYGDREPDKWRIKPALQNEIYRVPVHDNRQDRDRYWEREEIAFRKDTPPFIKVIGPGQDGWAIYSGPIQKKKKQWAISAENPQGKEIPIRSDDVEAYLSGGVAQIEDLGLPQAEQRAMPREELTRLRDEAEKDFRYSRDSARTPCFYVEWMGADGKKHISFGHTPNFRLPYQHSTAEAIPAEWKRKPTDTRWDWAQALFGRVPVRDATGKVDVRSGRRGRVFFEDGFQEKGEQDTRAVSVVLGTPKPTTYQHYLVQPGEDVQRSICWDGDYKGSDSAVATVRGHKRYWHRPGVPLPISTKMNVAGSMRRGRKGAEFKATVRYENLSDVELGLLLTAIDLPKGCGHKIGMGKPLGLGSFRVEVTAVEEIDRDARYNAFSIGEGDAERLATGKSVAGADRMAAVKKAFEAFFKGEGKTFWEDSRLAELKAMLTLDGLPANWGDRTRYLEFGQAFDRGEQRMKSYNEYTHTGYPGARELQKRRPLPPASQVLSDSKMPSDPRPDFKK